MNEKNGYQDLVISSGGVHQTVTAELLNAESTEVAIKAALRKAARELNGRVPSGTQLKDPQVLEKALTAVINPVTQSNFK